MTVKRLVVFFFFFISGFEKIMSVCWVWACYSMAEGAPWFPKPGELFSACTDRKVANLPESSFPLALKKKGRS